MDVKLRGQKSAEARKKNAARRRQRINERFNEIYSQTIEGIRPDYDALIRHLANEFCVSKTTVKNALKNG